MSARGHAFFELFIKIAEHELAPVRGKPNPGDACGPAWRFVAGAAGVHA
jgi:hypothetical protein